MKEKKIHDQDLGEITLRYNERAKRYLIRIKEGKIVAIIPKRGNKQTMLAFINEQRIKLLAMLQKGAKPLFLDEETNLQTFTFQLHIFRSQRTKFYATLKEKTLHIACPENTDFSNDNTQHLLQSILKQALKREAKRILPTRLEELAKQHNFHYNKVAVRDTKSRWGSCTSHKNISLSLSLMFLPAHLIDYILLHELCHTVEMNHGSHFWTLMNKVTNCQAKSLRNELKDYRML